MSLTQIVSIAGECSPLEDIPETLVALIASMLRDGWEPWDILASSAFVTKLFVPAEWASA